MKKTFTINISGTVFHIEEDAYEVLQKYLVNLKTHFGNEEEGKEILADIEARIAEIFAGKSLEENKVITLVWVEQVISVMGTPEDFVEEEALEEETFTAQRKTKRRLYRDPESRVIGGVCGGLGAYFNIDPVILRIIFVVLIFITTGAALLAYLILWIAVPKAVTTAQRLEMRGQEATVKNIEKSIREEVREVKESYNKFRRSESYAKGKKKMEGAGEVTYSIFKLLLKIALVIIGVILIISGLVGLVGLITTITMGQSLIEGVPMVWGPEIPFGDMLNYLVEPSTVTTGLILIGLLAGIPMLAMVYIGSKLVFRYKSNNTAVGLGLAGVWLVALIVLFVVTTSQLQNFKNEGTVIVNSTIDCNNCETLYLNVGEDRYKGYAAHHWDLNNLRVVRTDGKNQMIGNPRLDIEKANGEHFVLQIRKGARGRSRESARDYATDLNYNFQQNDSMLVFDPYFFPNDNKWRNQELMITLKVPEGKRVFIGEGMIDIIYDIENVTNTWDGDMVGKYWEMTPDGLTLVETEEISE
jgi:phage shock protein PspC (stress-responsive transcriptional regulator)